MGADSKIEWTHHTFNPWIGCAKVSPGCTNCYAEVGTFTRRLRAEGSEVWGPKALRYHTSDGNWKQPLKWNREAEAAGERRRVFCASMADVFEDRPDLVGPRARLFALVEGTPQLDWLLLTKRPENADRLWSEAKIRAHEYEKTDAPTWSRNVWLGTTVEDQRRADERIPHLLSVPAAVRFLSCEPLLERVDLERHLNGGKSVAEWQSRALSGFDPYGARPAYPRIDWVIVGGESGHDARPFDLAWAREIVVRCRAAGVAVHVKQLGADPVVGAPSRRAAGILHKKGGDIEEWPIDLRVREYPDARRTP